MRTHRYLATLLALVSLMPVALASPPPGPASPSIWPALTDVASDGSRRFVSTHVGKFNGKRIRYQATVAETLIRGPDSQPAASVFTTALTLLDRRASDRRDSRRPVIFLFNGGPGAASNTLFFGAFGPKRMVPFSSIAQSDPNTPVTDNDLTVLDVADLVFIDPPDTGFSRRLPGVPPRLFLSIDGDSYAVGQVILHWLRVNGRLGSPTYLAGESYGSLRCVALARDLARATPKVELDGVVLISQAITYNGPASLGASRASNLLRAVTRLPDIAAMAWYHGKIDNQSQSVEQAIRKAEAFARTEYVEALLLGNRIEPARRAQVAERLAPLTGIPADEFISHHLMITDYRRVLLKAEGRALAQFDGRETEPLSGLPKDEDRDWERAMAGLTANMERYASHELGVKGLESYISVVHDPYGYEEGWTYIVPPAPTLDAVLSEVMKASPKLRLMVPQGIFDTTSSMGSTVSLFAMLDLPADRVAIAYYPGGHMLYSDADGLKRFTDDVRAFVSGSNPGGSIPIVEPAVARAGSN